MRDYEAVVARLDEQSDLGDSGSGQACSHCGSLDCEGFCMEEAVREYVEQAGFTEPEAVSPEEATAARVVDYIHREQERETGSWPEPQPLPTPPEPEPLRAELLPDALSGWTFDTAERASAPPEFAALPLLISLGAVLGRRVALCPKALDDWHEFPNLWGMIVGPPGSLKSPVMAQALSFPRALESNSEEEWKETDLRDLERQAEKLRLSVAGIEKEAKRSDFDAAAGAGKLADQKRKLRETEVALKVGPPRLTTSDATIEKLGEILAANPRGIVLARDEAAGWLATLDREGRKIEREAWLELWAGREPVRTDRIGRGSIAVPSSVVSVVGSTQPGKMARYVAEAAAGGSGADGLLQRFAIVWPEIPDYDLVDRPPLLTERERVNRIFQALDRQDVGTEIGAHGAFVTSGTPSPGVHALSFDAEAQEMAFEWLQDVGTRARAEESETLAGWLAKMPKLFAGLSLIFHAVEVADGRRDPGPVGLSSARLAAAWCEVLLTHVRKVYGEHIDLSLCRASALASKIRVGAVCDGDPLRDIYRHHWSRLRTPEALQEASDTLSSRGWVRVDKESTGGRPSPVIRLNPRLEDLS